MSAAQSGRSPWAMDQVSLARVSVTADAGPTGADRSGAADAASRVRRWWGAGVGVLIWSRRTAAAAADGASPMTWPPPLAQAVASARRAVVFPAPAGAIASCSRAPEVAIPRTSAACPALRVTPFAADSSNASSTRWRVDGGPVEASGRVEEALLGGQDRGGGVLVGAVHRVDAGVVPAPQLRRLTDPVALVGETYRPAVEDLVDEQPHHRVHIPGSEVGGVGGSHPALRLGADVPHLPRAPARLQRGHDRGGRRVHPRGIHPPTRRPPEPLSGRFGAVAARIIASRAGSSPRTSTACRRHVARCSARVRGSFFASRVSRVACCASWIDSTAVGGRPWSRWKAWARSLRRATTAARRADHRSFRRGSTPTTSRTGRFRVHQDSCRSDAR